MTSLSDLCDNVSIKIKSKWINPTTAATMDPIPITFSIKFALSLNVWMDESWLFLVIHKKKEAPNKMRLVMTNRTCPICHDESHFIRGFLFLVDDKKKPTFIHSYIQRECKFDAECDGDRIHGSSSCRVYPLWLYLDANIVAQIA